MVRRTVSVLLVAALLASMAEAAAGLGPYSVRAPQPPQQVQGAPFAVGIWRLAQVSVVQSDSTASYTQAQGVGDGRSYARTKVGTGGRYALGFFLGYCTLGLAVPIAYFATGPASLTYPESGLPVAKRDEYLRGFATGFATESQSMRRKAVLFGGLAGAVVIYSVYRLLLPYLFRDMAMDQ